MFIFHSKKSWRKWPLIFMCSLIHWSWYVRLLQNVLGSWKFFVSTDNNDIVLFISSNNLGCSLLLLYTLDIRKICNFGPSKLKVSDSARVFLISINFIDITLHMQNAKQLDKFSWSITFFISAIWKILCQIISMFLFNFS